MTRTMTLNETIDGTAVVTVVVMKEDSAADTLTTTVSVDGKVTGETVTSLSTEGEIISGWSIQTNTDGTS